MNSEGLSSAGVSADLAILSVQDMVTWRGLPGNAPASHFWLALGAAVTGSVPSPPPIFILRWQWNFLTNLWLLASEGEEWQRANRECNIQEQCLGSVDRGHRLDRQLLSLLSGRNLSSPQTNFWVFFRQSMPYLIILRRHTEVLA